MKLPADDDIAILSSPQNETATLIIGARGQYEAKVSADHYPYLSRWRWTFKISKGGGVYARRGGGRTHDGELRPTILLHDVVMELKGKPRPSSRHTANHLNHDTLDCREDNLVWATPRQQREHQRKRR